MGQGAWSQANSGGARIRVIPGKMSPVVKDEASTATSLVLNWSSLISDTETGNSEILAYNVWWDSNTGTVNIDLFEGLTLTYTVSGLVPGNEYKFAIRARNIYGFGPYSDIVTLQPDAVPDMMNTPTTTLAYPTVTIHIEAPFDNGNEIDGYQIQIYSHIEGVFVEDTSVCDGSQQSVIDALACDVQMQNFITIFGYQHGQLILVKARAKNQVGWGSFSSQNSGGVITQTEPLFMNPPILDYAAMRDTSIKVDWSAITTDAETGGVAITSYSLEWDQATGNWVSIVGESSPSLALTYTVTSGVIPG